MDFDHDPELKAIRQDFIESLPPRLKALREASLSGNSVFIQKVAHQVAGVGQSFGFPALSRIGGIIDDLLDLPGSQAGQAAWVSRHQLLPVLVRALDRALETAYATQADPGRILAEPEVVQAIFVAESLVAGASL